MNRPLGPLQEPVDTLVDTQPPTPQVESWEIFADAVFNDVDLRLDAASYAPGIAAEVDTLASQGIPLQPLKDLATVTGGKRFERIYTDDPNQGIPYLNATDLLSLMAFGTPSKGMRYLSPATKTDINRLLIREGWLLMTCSGTVSRVFYVGSRLDGWAATHDIVRIVPHDIGSTGYLYAWLSTDTAKAQIASRQHGGVVNHVTATHIGESLVPRLGKEDEERINTQVLASLRGREKAIEFLATAWPL